jgi:chromosomal replication initiator protein
MRSEWSGVLDEIRREVSEMAYGAYFPNLRLVSIDNGRVVIEVPNVFIKTQMEGKYNRVIKRALRSAGVVCESLKFVEGAGGRKTIRRGIEVLPNTENLAKNTQTRRHLTNGENGLNQKYRFDNYIVGTNNDLAVSAAHAVVEDPGGRYNPYFVYGGPGLGKTHLIQAIGNEIVAQNPKMKVLYITIEQFYHEFVEAMRKKLDGFNNKYRRVDVLIVDDFQFIVGKDKSQNEFFHTFNELHQKNKQIIVSSDRLPTQIATVDERLSSRLMMGMPIDIQMPDFETRCAILKTKAEFLGAEIEDSAVEYLAENIKTNIRELEGKFNQLVALSDLRNMSPSEIISEGYLESDQHYKIRSITPKQVIEKVAKFYGLAAKDLLGTSRVAQIKTPRQVAMYLMNKELGLSTVRSGNEFSKDHTTLMHGVKKIGADLKLDFGLREQLATLREKLYGN